MLSSDKMKIIYITDQIYLHGGAEKILIQKLNYWVEWYGYEVLLITSEQKGKAPFFKLNEKVQRLDLAVDYEEGISYLHPKNLKKLPKHISKLKTAISDFNPDAIFLISLGFIRYILPFISGKFPIYNEYHTSYYGFELKYNQLSFIHRLKKQFSYLLIDLVETRYTKIVFLNDAEFNHYKRNNAVIIPNFFDEIKATVSVPKKNQLISLGRLCYQKGYDLLIDVWEIVDREKTGYTLQIYGNGEDHQMLQEKIAAKNLEHSLHLNPATNAINEKLSESQFYVMSSRFETFPMVILEALSNGLPVVSFNCPTGPASMLIQNQDGLMVPNGDIKALADAILLLINDRERAEKMGRAGLENVKRFNPKQVMEQWDQLIRANRI